MQSTSLLTHTEESADTNIPTSYHVDQQGNLKGKHLQLHNVIFIHLLFTANLSQRSSTKC